MAADLSQVRCCLIGRFGDSWQEHAVTLGNSLLGACWGKHKLLDQLESLQLDLQNCTGILEESHW